MRTLLTRDGRQIGNAIVIEELPFSEKLGRKVYVVETDFGNRCKLTQNEIEAWFYPGEEASYERWSTDREQLRKQTCFDDTHPEPDPSEDGVQIR